MHIFLPCHTISDFTCIYSEAGSQEQRLHTDYIFKDLKDFDDPYSELPYIMLFACEENVELQYFDYVTLYDHSDKYKVPGMPINPYAKVNRYSELTEIVKGPTQIWRTSNSTTMTFAVTGKTLKADADIWSITKIAKKDFDFDNFCVITKQPLLPKSRFIKQIPRRLQFWSKPKRYLGICIPGLSLHLEQGYLGPTDPQRFLSEFVQK